jgi:hypothetical protein
MTIYGVDTFSDSAHVGSFFLIARRTFRRPKLGDSLRIVVTIVVTSITVGEYSGAGDMSSASRAFGYVGEML